MKPEVREAVAVLWRELGSRLGGLFTSTYGSVGGPAFNDWCVTLHDMSPQQIGRGLGKYLDMDLEEAKRFRLHAVSFRALCKPSLDDFGLPDATVAYDEACRNSHSLAYARWSHPAVYVAGSTAGWFTLRSESRHRAFPVFQKHYAEACKRVMAGEDLGHALRGLPKPDEYRAPKAVPSSRRGRGNAVLQQLLHSVKGVA